MVVCVVYVDGGNYMTANSIILDPTDCRPVYVMNNNENRPAFGIANDSETLRPNILPIYRLGDNGYCFINGKFTKNLVLVDLVFIMVLLEKDGIGVCLLGKRVIVVGLLDK